MFRAVIFDFGGVLTTSPFEAFARFERDRELPAGLIRKINSLNPHDNAWARFERSEIDLDSFDAAFAAEAAALGHDVRGREILALLRGQLRPEMVDLLRRLRAGYKTGCITNNVSVQQTDTGEESPYARDVVALFDHVIESSKVGIRKPNPRIYEMMCEALAVEPGACVYLDDLGINLKPARAMGMTTIKVESAEQAIADLEAVLGNALA